VIIIGTDALPVPGLAGTTSSTFDLNDTTSLQIDLGMNTPAGIESAMGLMRPVILETLKYMTINGSKEDIGYVNHGLWG
jgi:hypothetical protein